VCLKGVEFFSKYFFRSFFLLSTPIFLSQKKEIKRISGSIRARFNCKTNHSVYN
jgi:hypothetical protein